MRDWPSRRACRSDSRQEILNLCTCFLRKLHSSIMLCCAAVQGSLSIYDCKLKQCGLEEAEGLNPTPNGNASALEGNPTHPKLTSSSIILTAAAHRASTPLVEC